MSKNLIYFLRHGDAEDLSEDDAACALTAKGVRQAAAAGEALVVRGAEIEACLTSPKLRAERTAVLTCQALGIELERAPELRGGPFDSFSLVAGRGGVLLVGHEPDFSSEVARLTGARVKLRKGGLAIVDGSTLLALLRPGDLSALAERSAG